MVDAKWNDRTRHFEARVMREKFSYSPARPIVSQEDEEASQTARSAWMARWSSRFGDSPEVWIEIPEAKVNPVLNPTGHAVLCWSVFGTELNGVYCFMPFISAFNERFALMSVIA
jgi:hypothetical protein